MYNFKYEISAATCGKFGRANQDNLLIDKYTSNLGRLKNFSCRLEVIGEQRLVFGVFDGIGGAKDGAAASEIAVRTLLKFLDGIKGESTDDGIPEGGMLYSAINRANENVVNYFEKLSGRGGTTLSLFCVDNRHAYILNAGDSPVFILRRGHSFSEYTEEHTLAAERGESDPQKCSHNSNILTRFIGREDMSGRDMLHIRRIELRKNDTILLCTDGVTKGVNLPLLKKMLIRSKPGLAEEIVRTAEENNADDDITAIVIKVREDR